MTGPVTAYLDRLALRSRPTYAGDARTLARMAFSLHQGPVDGLPWHALGVGEGVAVREALIARYAPGTARRMLLCYKGILRECWRQGQMSAESLARALDVPPVRGSRVGRGRALTWAEVGRLLAAARSPRDRALLAVLAGAGLRRAEAVAVRPEDVRRRAGRLELLVQGKGQRERRVALPGWAAESLTAHLRGGSAPQVFGLRHDSAVAKIVRATAERAGLGRLSPHDLRRTYASLALGAGMPIESLRRAMGHANIQMTTVYDRRPDEDVLAEAGRLDGGLAGLDTAKFNL